MKHLRKLQRRFQDYLIGGSEDIEQDIISTDTALAEHRLGTYYNAYRIRLIDCLAVDYAAPGEFDSPHFRSRMMTCCVTSMSLRNSAQATSTATFRC